MALIPYENAGVRGVCRKRPREYPREYPVSTCPVSTRLRSVERSIGFLITCEYCREYPREYPCEYRVSTPVGDPVDSHSSLGREAHRAS